MLEKLNEVEARYDELNTKLSMWLQNHYHIRQHSSTGTTPQARFQAGADSQSFQGTQHVKPQATRTNHGSNNNHVKRQHDHLIDPDHESGPCRRNLYFTSGILHNDMGTSLRL